MKIVKLNEVVYYAHAKKLYCTVEEKVQLQWLRSTFKRVIDPNSDLGELGSITKYLEIIKQQCTVVVCSEYFDYVGRGVFEELQFARKSGMPIFCLRKVDGDFILCRIKNGKIVDKNDWVNYAKLDIIQGE